MVALRIAWRDAKRHRLRTILAVLLISVPLIAGVSLAIALSTREDVASSMQRALPDGAGAMIEAYPLPAAKLPLKQPYHGAMLVISSTEDMASDGAQVSAVVGSEVEEVFQSSNLLLHSRERFTVASLTEANSAMRFVNPEAEKRLQQIHAPEASQTKAPTSNATSPSATIEPVVITTVVAHRLQVNVGDDLEVVSSSHLSEPELVNVRLRVESIVPGEDAQLYARFGALKQERENKPGVERLFYTAANVNWQSVKQLNQLGALVVSREVLQHPPAPKDLYPVSVSLQRMLLNAGFLGVAGAAAVLLGLFLLTPAFTVSAEQFTRSLALIAVVGAAPKQLRRIMAAHGLVVGSIAGVLGAGLGTGSGILLLWLRLRALARETGITGPAVELGYNLRFVPWMLVPLALALGVVAGYLAAYLPAHWAAKQNLLKSLSGRGQARRRPPRLWLATVMLLLAGAFWVTLLWLPSVLTTSDAQPRMSVLFASLAVLGTLLNVLAAIAVLPFIFRLLQRLPMPLVGRLAARDAYQHRRRAVPTAAAIMVLVVAVTAVLVIAATDRSNQRDISTLTRGKDAVIIAPRIYSDWDDSLLQQGVKALQLPVKKTVPVLDVDDGGLQLDPRQPCPAGEDVNIEARLELNLPIECVPYYVPKYISAPLETIPHALVMDAEALAASGLPISSQVLDAGGVIVGDASSIEGGNAHLTVVNEQNKPVRSALLPADFLPNVITIVSPGAAKELALPAPRQIGWFLVFDRPVSPEEFEQAWQRLGDLSALLVHDGPGYQEHDFIESTITGAAVMFIVLILWLTLALARTTMRADIATLNVLGAPPSLPRRYSAAQALIVALSAVPLGVMSGLAVAYGVTTINRIFPLESGGPFRLFVIPSTVPLVAVAMVLVAVVLGWLSGGMKGSAPARRME